MLRSSPNNMAKESVGGVPLATASSPAQGAGMFQPSVGNVGPVRSGRTGLIRRKSLLERAWSDQRVWIVGVILILGACGLAGTALLGMSLSSELGIIFLSIVVLVVGAFAASILGLWARERIAGTSFGVTDGAAPQVPLVVVPFGGAISLSEPAVGNAQMFERLKGQRYLPSPSVGMSPPLATVDNA